MEETDKIVKPTQPWWKNGWVAGLLILGLLHATGMAVHVQAGFQRILLVTGLFNPDLVPEGQRLEADLHFMVVDAAGDVRSPGSSIGQVRFINFWATWCAPCLAEMPAIARLHRDYGDQVEFIMVSMDEDLDLAERFLESKDYRLKAVQPASSIPRSLTTGLIPTTVVVDRKGRIAVHEAGMADYDSREFRNVLDRLLQESRPDNRQASLRR